MNQQRTSSIRKWISNLLFIVAAVLFAYVAYAWYQERNEPSTQVPTPQSVPGQAELKNVHDAIASQGASVDYGRQTVRVEGLQPVGQQLMVEGAPVYVFIFESPDARAAQSGELDLDAIEIKTPSGADAATGDLVVTEGSNILTISDGAPEDVQAKIDAGVQGLP